MARNKPRGPGPGPRTKLERFIQDNSESGLETNGLLVGVFDGHSGQFASAFARKMFPKELAVIVADGQGESRVAAVEQALRHTFANVSGCMRQYVLAHQTTDPDTAPAPRSPPRNSGPVRNADTRARIERISGQSKGIAGQNGAAAERTEGSVTEDAAHTEQTSRADGSFRIGSKEHIAGCAVLVVVVLQGMCCCVRGVLYFQSPYTKMPLFSLPLIQITSYVQWSVLPTSTM
ncbi:hypothetical protein SARC_08065 [Sphaeroforma arctica JP610]|uniref:PPM-type phosphatase domain-containing protein n=1 Tax=Sphaeroforma arctica JP610 TaxID=667725 RepID=A0A0L0FSH8_9EUKA|nr:hypothetical protein SARC_08065 [Sphaeroforma arctica JP610]KNC79546.1 hypothetical protein SARC_08065 [Sphaeroforma arctica JP610]|eukprot:XP_014153448.1 hypothetical protein SARC_08065 [Sphaeroforma arctica JP610]